MKINPFDKPTPIQKTPEKPQETTKIAGKSFQNVLNEHLKVSNSEKPAAPSSPPPLGGVSNVPIDFGPVKTETIKSVDRLLTLLENYKMGLEDGNISLKALDKDVKIMDDAQKKLASMTESLPDDDGLKNIANEALIIVTMEIERFNTGYYL